MLDEVLSRVLESIQGCRASLLVGMDGMIVAGSGDSKGLSWELVVASYADLLRRVAAANLEAEIAAPAELVMICPSVTFAFRSINAEYGLLAAIEPGASLGKTRFELRKAASRILPELEGDG